MSQLFLSLFLLLSFLTVPFSVGCLLRLAPAVFLGAQMPISSSVPTLCQLQAHSRQVLELRPGGLLEPITIAREMGYVVGPDRGNVTNPGAFAAS